MTDEIPDDTDVMQVHHETDGEFEELTRVTVEEPEPEWSRSVNHDSAKREVIFSRGGDIHMEDRDQPFEIQSGERIQRTIVRDFDTATGYYLHALEIHGAREEDTLQQMDQHVDLGPYTDLQNRLTPRKRRLLLMDFMEWRAGDGEDFIAAKYLEHPNCRWRSTSLAAGRKLARHIAHTCELHPRTCYYSAGEAAIKHIDNHRVEYAEGFVLPKQAGQATRHAWLEIDGNVAEVTWPWHMFDGSDAVYFGLTIPKEEVKESRRSDRDNGPVILSDDEMEELEERTQP